MELRISPSGIVITIGGEKYSFDKETLRMIADAFVELETFKDEKYRPHVELADRIKKRVKRVLKI